MNEVKIKEPETICLDREHEPASMKYREAGTYEHTCPSCGKKTVFEVPLVTC